MLRSGKERADTIAATVIPEIKNQIWWIDNQSPVPPMAERGFLFYVNHVACIRKGFRKKGSLFLFESPHSVLYIQSIKNFQ